MAKIMHFLYFFGILMSLQTVESGYYDYDNEVYDYYRQESSNQNNVQTKVIYDCKEEGFHEDPNDCRNFYRCVDWGNGSPLTPFKFECGIGTVFSKAKGNICVHPNDSGRPECCEPGNEIDSNEPDHGNEWNKNPPPGQQQPSYPSQPPQIPNGQNYPPQNPNESNYPPQKPTQAPQYQTSAKPSLPPQSSQSQYAIPTLGPQISTQTQLGQSTTQSNYPSQSAISETSETNSVGCGSGQRSCGSSPGCTAEGFYPNPEDCHKFYRCVDENSHLQRYDFTCGTGTAWDQALQTCNHEHEVSSCGSGNLQTSSPSVQYPSPQSTASPTQSSYPSPQPTQNPSKPTYNPAQPTQGPIQTPNPPYQPPVQSTPNSIQTSYPAQASSQLPAPSTKGPEYIPPQQISSATPSNNGGKPCPPSGSSKDCQEEGFFPNSQDCHKFYRCVNEDGSFHRYDFECGTGTAWDKILQTCNYESAIPGCLNSGSSPITSSPGSGLGPNDGKPDSGNTTNLTSTTTTSDQSTQPTMQPSTSSSSTTSQSSAPVTRPSTTSPSDNKNQSTTASILEPTHPSTEQSTSTQAIPSQTSPSSQFPSSTASTENSSTIHSGSENNPSQKPTGVCQEEGFFANSNNCRKFYRCVSNPPGFIKYDFDCGPGTAWDQSLLTCNYISQVASCSSENNDKPPSSESSSTLPSQSTSPSPSTSTSQSTSPASPEQSPESSKPVSSTTPVPGTTSSTSLISSSPLTSSTENSSEPSKPDCNPPKQNNTIVCNDAGFYPHPTRCDKFYRCVDNGKGFNVYHFDCAPGTIFDPTIDVCNYPESVYPARNCEYPSSSQESTPSSQAISSTTPESTSAGNITKPGVITSTTTSPTEGMSSTNSEAPTTESSTEESQTSGATEESSETTTPSMEMTTTSAESTSPSSESTTQSSDASTIEGESTTSATSPSMEKTTTGSTEVTTEESSSETTTSATEATSPEEQQSTMSTATQETTILPTTPTESSTTPTESATAPTESPTASTESPTVTTESATASTESPTASTEPPTGPTETPESTTPSTSDKPPTPDNCPMPANLTDEQLVLVCPTGFRRHPKLCNLFYQCTMSGNMEVKILILQCPNGTIFDEKDNKCLSETDSNQPCTGSVAGKRVQRRVVNNNSPDLVEVSSKPLCPDEGHFPFRDGCSNVFYKCKRNSRYDLEGFLYKCPKDFVYWSVSRRCERATRLPSCSAMSNETENEIENWDKRWEIPIEDRNLSARSLLYF